MFASACQRMLTPPQSWSHLNSHHGDMFPQYFILYPHITDGSASPGKNVTMYLRLRCARVKQIRLFDLFRAFVHISCCFHFESCFEKVLFLCTCAACSELLSNLCTMPRPFCPLLLFSHVDIVFFFELFLKSTSFQAFMSLLTLIIPGLIHLKPTGVGGGGNLVILLVWPFGS